MRVINSSHLREGKSMSQKVTYLGHGRSHDGSTGIHLRISEEVNEVIETCSKRNMRSKRSEATLRLEDHCKSFPDWNPS